MTKRVLHNLYNSCCVDHTDKCCSWPDTFGGRRKQTHLPSRLVTDPGQPARTNATRARVTGQDAKTASPGNHWRPYAPGPRKVCFHLSFKHQFASSQPAPPPVHGSLERYGKPSSHRRRQFGQAQSRTTTLRSIDDRHWSCVGSQPLPVSFIELAFATFWTFS